jgi:hypothetical protein
MKKFLSLYIEGFKHLSTLSKTLWLIILIKFFIMFFILKMFFFPNILKKNFKTDEERSNYVIEKLINNE